MKTPFLNLFLLSAACLTGMVMPTAAQKISDKESAQLVAEGRSFLNSGQTADALFSFRKAAKAGNVEGALAAGNLLSSQARSSSGRERILKFSESIGYLFFAATNRSPQACADLSGVLQNGIGVQSNLIAAYAWMKLAVQLDRSRKPDLDRLVVQLQPGDVRQAQELADEYRLGHWPSSLVRPVDEQDSRLKVQGISLSSRKPLVVLNGTTFAAGDTIEVHSANGPKRTAADKLTVKCLEIGDDYVLIAITGESNLKLLSTDRLSRN